MSLVVRLPFPDPSLFPNRKNGKHWGETNAIKVQQHDAAYWSTKAAGSFSAPDGYIPLSLLFLTPDKRRRDGDGLLSASKAILDGVAAALGIDDSRFKPILIDWCKGPDKVGALIAGVGVQMSLFVEFGGESK